MNPGGLPSLDVRQAAELLDGAGAPGRRRPLVVDVRNPDEFVTARIAGAVLMPLPTFTERFRELPADRPLLVVCHVGGRSAAATAHLLRNGYDQAVNVAGGMEAWAQAGLPTIRGPVAPGEGELPGEDGPSG